MDIPINKSNKFEIIKKLSDNSVLIKNWLVFAHRLQVFSTDYLRLANYYKSRELTSYDLVFEIVTIWMTQEGCSATPKKLIEHLRKMSLNLVADEIESLFEREQKPLEISALTKALAIPNNGHEILKEKATDELYSIYSFFNLEISQTFLQLFYKKFNLNHHEVPGLENVIEKLCKYSITVIQLSVKSPNHKAILEKDQLDRRKEVLKEDKEKAQNEKFIVKMMNTSIITMDENSVWKSEDLSHYKTYYYHLKENNCLDEINTNTVLCFRRLLNLCLLEIEDFSLI